MRLTFATNIKLNILKHPLIKAYNSIQKLKSHSKTLTV